MPEAPSEVSSLAPFPRSYTEESEPPKSPTPKHKKVSYKKTSPDTYSVKSSLQNTSNTFQIISVSPNKSKLKKMINTITNSTNLKLKKDTNHQKKSDEELNKLSPWKKLIDRYDQNNINLLKENKPEQTTYLISKSFTESERNKGNNNKQLKKKSHFSEKLNLSSKSFIEIAKNTSHNKSTILKKPQDLNEDKNRTEISNEYKHITMDFSNITENIKDPLTFCKASNTANRSNLEAKIYKPKNTEDIEMIDPQKIKNIVTNITKFTHSLNQTEDSKNLLDTLVSSKNAENLLETLQGVKVNISKLKNKINAKDNKKINFNTPIGAMKKTATAKNKFVKNLENKNINKGINLQTGIKETSTSKVNKNLNGMTEIKKFLQDLINIMTTASKKEELYKELQNIRNSNDANPDQKDIKGLLEDMYSIIFTFNKVNHITSGSTNKKITVNNEINKKILYELTGVKEALRNNSVKKKKAVKIITPTEESKSKNNLKPNSGDSTFKSGDYIVQQALINVKDQTKSEVTTISNTLVGDCVKESTQQPKKPTKTDQKQHKENNQKQKQIKSEENKIIKKPNISITNKQKSIRNNRLKETEEYSRLKQLIKDKLKHGTSDITTSNMKKTVKNVAGSKKELKQPKTLSPQQKLQEIKKTNTEVQEVSGIIEETTNKTDESIDVNIDYKICNKTDKQEVTNKDNVGDRYKPLSVIKQNVHQKHKNKKVVKHRETTSPTTVTTFSTNKEIEEINKLNSKEIKIEGIKDGNKNLILNNRTEIKRSNPSKENNNKVMRKSNKNLKSNKGESKDEVSPIKSKQQNRTVKNSQLKRKEENVANKNTSITTLDEENKSQIKKLNKPITMTNTTVKPTGCCTENDENLKTDIRKNLIIDKITNQIELLAKETMESDKVKLGNKNDQN